MLIFNDIIPCGGWAKRIGVPIILNTKYIKNFDSKYTKYTFYSSKRD